MEDIFEELAAAASDEERVEGNDPETRADEAEEVNGESRRVVKPKRTNTSAPRPKLDPARLIGPRGIFVLSSMFDNVKFKGKGRELDDLNNILSRLQHWAHRLFPKMTFEDCISKIEELGQKREIQTNMHKLRMGMVDLDAHQETVLGDDEVRAVSPSPMVDDAFDQLISTVPAPVKQTTLTDEQRARMMRNRLLAEERRMARRLARERELAEQRQAISQDPELNLHQNVGNASSPEPVEVPSTAAVSQSIPRLILTAAPAESTTEDSLTKDQVDAVHIAPECQKNTSTDDVMDHTAVAESVSVPYLAMCP